MVQVHISRVKEIGAMSSIWSDKLRNSFLLGILQLPAVELFVRLHGPLADVSNVAKAPGTVGGSKKSDDPGKRSSSAVQLNRSF
jgi:hypothetical protein